MIVRENKLMVFEDEDNKTVKSIGLMAGGFGVLTVVLIVLSVFIT